MLSLPEEFPSKVKVVKLILGAQILSLNSKQRTIAKSTVFKCNVILALGGRPST